VQYVDTMIRRDWNHPSIILWGVRSTNRVTITDFYTRTNKLAHDLDDSRQTGGVRFQIQLGTSRRRLHDERFRIPASSAESSAAI
jgi:beta-galactosidase/beta-glucuronidase